METLARKQDSKFYEKNYRQLLKENDADKYGLIKAYGTLTDYAPDLSKKYNLKKILDMVQEYDKNYYEAVSSISEKGTISLKTEIETKAAMYIMDHPEVLQEFPILNIAFNKDGNKKDIIELLEGRNELLESNQNTKMINELYKIIIDNRNLVQGGLKGTKDELLKLQKYIKETGTEDEFIYDLMKYKLEHKTNMTQEQIDSMIGKLHDEASKSRKERNEQEIEPQGSESIRDEIGDEFQPKTEAQRQEQQQIEEMWKNRFQAWDRNSINLPNGAKRKKEAVKEIQNIEKDEQIEQKEANEKNGQR